MELISVGLDEEETKTEEEKQEVEVTNLVSNKKTKKNGKSQRWLALSGKAECVFIPTTTTSYMC